MRFAIITENDKSQWDDNTGEVYHFPRRYERLIPSGTRVIYYKGTMRDRGFATTRLSPNPHYFGVATIGQIYPDKNSKKGDLFAFIEGFRRFDAAVEIAPNGVYLETIPPSRANNYWRDGVRAISARTYDDICRLTGLKPEASENIAEQLDELESGVEGNPSQRYVTTYERDRRNRQRAIAIHGLRCFGCEVDMGEKYGPYAQGLIHIHHIVPVSLMEGPRKVDPAKELVPVCPNCHAVIHRQRDSTLSIDQLRKLLDKGPMGL